MGVFSINTNTSLVAPAATSGRSTGHVAGSVRKTVILAWILAGVWNLFTWPMFYVMLTQPNQVKHPPVPPELAFSPFLVIGLVLLGWAIRETAQMMKFGDPALDIDFLPVPIGGRLEGRITIQVPLGGAPPFALTFSCINRVVTGSGKSRSTSEYVLYHDDQTVALLPGGIIPVTFNVPPDGQETNMDNRNNCILWRVRAKADFPGIPFSEQYEVPVAANPLVLPPDQAALVAQSTAAHRAEVDHYQRPADSRIYVRPTADGKTEFFFSAGRNGGPTYFLIVFVSIMLIVMGLVHDTVFSWVVGAMVVIAGIGMLQLLFGTTTVTIGAGQMEIRNALLGVNYGTTTIPADDVIEFRTTVGMSMSGTGAAAGAGSSVYYDIEVVCKDGTVKAGTGMADKMEAESLAAQLGRCLLGR